MVNIVMGTLFIFIAVRDNTAPALGYFFLLFLGVVYYLLRQRVLAKEGISLEALIKNEVEEASRATQEAIP